MQTMVPLYGFGGGTGGTGAALTVTAPAGATVTVSKDGKSKTKVADLDGVAVFKGLATGQWTLSITDGEQTAQKTVTITADYTAEITFFAATIHVTYPAGSTCTATDGVTIIPAPDTSGTWDCVVENAGTWTVSLDSGLAETIDVTTSGETYTIDRWYLYEDGYFMASVEHTEYLSPSDCAVTYNDSNMQVSTVAGKTSEVYCVLGPIDITHINKLTADFTFLRGYSSNFLQMLTIFVSDTPSASYKNALAIGSDNGRYAVSGNSQSVNCDVSSLSGLRYISVGTNTQGSAWASQRDILINRVQVV